MSRSLRQSEDFIEMLKRLLSTLFMSKAGGGITHGDFSRYEEKAEKLIQNLSKMENEFAKNGDPQSALICRMKQVAYEKTLETMRNTNSADMSSIDLDQYSKIVSTAYMDAVEQATLSMDSDTLEESERKQTLNDSKHFYEGLSEFELHEKFKAINDFCSDSLRGEKIASHVHGVVEEVDKIAMDFMVTPTSPAVNNGVEEYREPKKEIKRNLDQEFSREHLIRRHESNGGRHEPNP